MLRCTACGHEYPETKVRYTCDCGSVLLVERDYKKALADACGLERYKSFLPVKKLVSLQEGETPLVECRHIEKELGLESVFVKFEGLNPTGSFKDRGSAVTVAKALEFGYKTTAVASTGNMAASVAAYSARAGLNCNVFVPYNTPMPKLAQVMMYGGRLIKVHGEFHDCIELARKQTASYLTMSGMNPYYIEGEKTIAFEIAEEMKPDAVFVPTGTGGLLTSIAKGFREFGVRKAPRMVACQLNACAPISDAFARGLDAPLDVEPRHSLASAILIKSPLNGISALSSMRDTDGFGTKVTDVEILKAAKLLGREGIFAEPAACASLAGLARSKKDVARDDKIVLIVTGHGLKDPWSYIKVHF